MGKRAKVRRLKRRKKIRMAPKPVANPLELTPQEFNSFIKFRRFLARELKAMGIKTKLDIDVVQDPIKWKKKIKKI